MALYEARDVPVITARARHHLVTLRMTVTGVPYWVWPLPVILGLAIIAFMQTPLGWVTEKPYQEIIAPTVIGLAACLSLFVHRWAGTTFTLILACFCWALFLREIRIPGSSKGMYASLVILAYWASLRRDELRTYLARQPVASLLAAAAWTYFFTKLLDQHHLNFLPRYYDWNNNVEESLETLAHLMVFALVVAALRTAWLHDRNAIVGGNAQRGRKRTQNRGGKN